MKTCTQCQAEKPLDQFYAQERGLDGRRSRCIPCEARDVEDRRILRTYGITREQYDAMFEAQGGVCALCFEPETNTYKGRVRALSVDHDHRTGAVRALLCSTCNRGIGLLGDDPELLRRAADYLDRAP